MLFQHPFIRLETVLRVTVVRLLISCQMEDISASVMRDHVLYDFGKCILIITTDVEIFFIISTDADYRNIVFRKDCLQVFFQNITEICCYLNNTVKVLKIRDIKRCHLHRTLRTHCSFYCCMSRRNLQRRSALLHASKQHQ